MASSIRRIITGKLEQAYRLLFTRYASLAYDIVLIVEFPKSGGTWLGQLVSSYRNLPFPRNDFPIPGPTLIHSHYQPSRGIKRTKPILWLVRDGRDVMVSLYHQYLIWNDKNRLNPKNVHYHRSQVPFNDYENKRENMPAFIHYTFEHRPSILQQFTHPGTWVTYNQHWLHAARSGWDQIVMTRYEDLLDDTVAELRRILIEAFGMNDDQINQERVEQIVEHYSFENQTKRRKGKESEKSFLRKGISGDWKNYFTNEAAQVFDHYAGDMLIELGYESDRSWTDKLKVNT